MTAKTVLRIDGEARTCRIDHEFLDLAERQQAFLARLAWEHVQAVTKDPPGKAKYLDAFDVKQLPGFQDLKLENIGIKVAEFVGKKLSGLVRSPPKGKQEFWVLDHQRVDQVIFTGDPSAIRRWLALDEDNPNPLQIAELASLRCLMETGQPEQAILGLGRRLWPNDLSVQAVLLEAECHLNLQDLESAEQSLQRLTFEERENPRLGLTLLVVQAKQTWLRRDLIALKRCITQLDLVPEGEGLAASFRGLLAREEHRYAESNRAFEAAIEPLMRTRHWSVLVASMVNLALNHYAMAKESIASPQWEMAKAWLDQARSFETQTGFHLLQAVAHVMRAKMARCEGDLDLARKLLENSMQRSSTLEDLAEAHLEMAKLEDLEGRTFEAERHFLQASELEISADQRLALRVEWDSWCNR